MHVKQPSSFFSICCNLELISYNYYAARQSGCMIIVGYANQFKVTINKLKKKLLGCLTCMIIVGYANQFKVTINKLKKKLLGCLTCMIIVGYANQFKVTTN